MRKVGFILSFLAIILVGSQANAQGEVNQEKGAILTLDKEAHNYGTIVQGADGVCKFVVTNKGNEPLIISKCQQSCGCTVPQCPMQPIAPGKSVEIVVTYDTKRVGPINKSVTIMSNAANEPNKVIRILGDVKAKAVENAPEK